MHNKAPVCKGGSALARWGIVMDRKHNPKLNSFAKNLRKNMTKEERKLWYEFFKDYPVKILRQKIIGKYIVDFYCAQANLVIEIDGSGHYEADKKAEDQERTKYLNEYGITVIRICNTDVLTNFYGVCSYIDKKIKQSLRLC